MYDWANSAYITTVSVGVLPIFFADVIVGPSGVTLFGISLKATTLWSWLIGFSAFLVFLSAPVLGAIADYSSSKKRFLALFCYSGVLGTLLLISCGPGDIIKTALFFILAQTGFVGGNVFYDSFLPHIATEDNLDRVSGKGFAYGYIGGGVQFALSLGIIVGHETLGISSITAVRIAIAMAAFWWGGFALLTFAFLKEERPAKLHNGNTAITTGPFDYLRIGFSRTWQTALKVKQFKHLTLFLIAFMIYNDGIQTVISMSTIYGREELKLLPRDLMLTLLIIQFVAFFGALLFARIAEWLSAKTALLITLCLWSAVVIYAYFMTSTTEFYILGMVVGLCMGGSQALSRSLYGSIIPADASAEFYGFYSVFNKFSSIWGPLAFGLITAIAGSSRQAVLSLIVFFIVGIILLLFVNVAKAREARDLDIFSMHDA